MPLWGTTHDSATNKPKFLPDDVNSKYDVTQCYATLSGWVQRAGTAATGNGNLGAQEEVLVAIGGLAGATATTGLKYPTMTKFRVLTKVDHGTSGNITFEITWDEQIKYVAGSVARYVLDGAAGSNVNADATHVDGVAIANGSIGNTFRFTATSAQATTYTLNDNLTMGNRTDHKDAITLNSLNAAQSTTLSAAIKTAIGVTTIVIA
jgi:hypothetical protein